HSRLSRCRMLSSLPRFGATMHGHGEGLGVLRRILPRADRRRGRSNPTRSTRRPWAAGRPASWTSPHAYDLAHGRLALGATSHRRMPRSTWVRRVVQGRAVHEARDGAGHRGRDALARPYALRRRRSRPRSLRCHEARLGASARGRTSRRARGDASDREARADGLAIRTQLVALVVLRPARKPAEAFINADPDAWYS